MVFVRRLRWDPGNVAHIARHQVSPDEVEQVCHGEHIEHVASAGRVMLLGISGAGRMLAVVLEAESGGVYYPLTARPASRKERRLYQHQQGGEQ